MKYARKRNNRIIEKGWIIIYIYIKVENLNETLKTIENERGWTVCE